jgi:hypothetical protein
MRKRFARLSGGFLVVGLLVAFAPAAGASQFSGSCSMTVLGPVVLGIPGGGCQFDYGCGTGQGPCAFQFEGTLSGLGLVHLETSFGRCVGLLSCRVTAMVVVPEGTAVTDECLIGVLTNSAAGSFLGCQIS